MCFIFDPVNCARDATHHHAQGHATCKIFRAGKALDLALLRGIRSGRCAETPESTLPVGMGYEAPLGMAGWESRPAGPPTSLFKRGVPGPCRRCTGTRVREDSDGAGVGDGTGDGALATVAGPETAFPQGRPCGSMVWQSSGRLGPHARQLDQWNADGHRSTGRSAGGMAVGSPRKGRR